MDDMVSQGQALAARAHDAVDRQWATAGPALLEEGDAILKAADALVPVLTGRLRHSGRTLGPIYFGDTVTVTIGYYEDYAAAVHERTWVHHPHGQAKFLEQPFKAAADGFSSRIAARIASRVAL